MRGGHVHVHTYGHTHLIEANIAMVKYFQTAMLGADGLQVTSRREVVAGHTGISTAVLTLLPCRTRVLAYS